MKKYHPETLAIHGFKEESAYLEQNQALFLTSSFKFPDAQTAKQLFLGNKEGYTYSRAANPTVNTFVQRLALLEEAAAGQATATGMAAIQATFLSFLKAGDHLVVSQELFGTTISLIDLVKELGIAVTEVKLKDLTAWQEAIQPNTKLFFVETPSNPLGEVVDIAQLAAIAHRQDILLAVDNTFCTPVLQRPLLLGADLVIHSATKWIDGQGRVSGGAILGNHTLVNKIWMHVKTAGQTLSSFNAWILLSGVETLYARVEKQSHSAKQLAQWLEHHPKIEKVFYTGLASHPQKRIIDRQQKAGGAVLSFRVKEGRKEAWQIIDNIRLFCKTGNLGDVRSIITHPFTTTHARVSAERKNQVGITENLIRISVGLEHIEDLQEALDEVLINAAF